MLSISDIHKSFRGARGDSRVVLCETTLTANLGEILVLVGPNGCGKTTLLNVVAGIILPDKGQALLNGRTVDSRKVGYVFQDFQESLLPWRTLLSNVELPLEIRGDAKYERKEKSMCVLKTVGLQDHAYRPLFQLSGGQKQLGAIARALVSDPELLLLDEPFSSVEFSTRHKLVQHLRRLIGDKPTLPVLITTHHLEEAILVGDRIAIMSQQGGRIASVLKIDLDDPRPRCVPLTEELQHLRDRILDEYKETKDEK